MKSYLCVNIRDQVSPKPVAFIVHTIMNKIRYYCSRVKVLSICASAFPINTKQTSLSHSLLHSPSLLDNPKHSSTPAISSLHL